MAWFREALSGSVWLDDLEPLLDLHGELQRIRYFQSREFGKVLVINEELQHVEAWAPLYHEIVVHLPCSLIVEPRKALILGGGSLFAATELLKYDSIEQIDLVDYDTNMIQASAQVYPRVRNVLNDKRLNITVQDCTKFLNVCRNQYDLIINDCFDLYEEDRLLKYDLYQIIYNRMSENGICSDLVYRSIYHDDHTRNALRRISKYKNKAITLLAVPEYPGFLHLLTMWGKNVNVYQRQRTSFNKLQMSMHDRAVFQIYIPNNLSFYFYVPPYISNFVTR